MILSTFGAGCFYYLKEKARFTQATDEALTAIADLKANQIADWVAERRRDASLILNNPMVIAQARLFLAGSTNAAVGRDLLKWMEALQSSYDYSRVARAIPGTAWFMVAKVDQEEVLAPLRMLAWTTSLTVAALALAASFAVLRIWKRRDLQFVSQQLAEQRRRGVLVARIACLLKENLTRLSSAVERSLHDAENRRRRRAAEEALRESEGRFATIFRASPIAICVTREADGLIIDANEAFLGMFGYARAEIIGRTSSELRLFADVEGRDKLVHRLRQNGQLRDIEVEYRRKTGEIRELSLVAELVRLGDGSCILSLIQDVTERKSAEKAVRASLEERTALLKEVHHRVKNNLQIVASLLNLQARPARNPAALDTLRDTQGRIRAMALLHETLHREGNAVRVNCAAYLGHLCAGLGRALGLVADRVRIEKRIAPVELEIDQAIPCGLIVNELVSNALKYAFPGERRGQITVELLAAAGGRVLLTVSDDGVGLPPGLDFERADSLGLRLVVGLAKQIQATLEVSGDHGAAFRITFPIPAEHSTDVV